MDEKERGHITTTMTRYDYSNGINRSVQPSLKRDNYHEEEEVKTTAHTPEALHFAVSTTLRCLLTYQVPGTILRPNPLHCLPRKTPGAVYSTRTYSTRYTVSVLVQYTVGLYSWHGMECHVDCVIASER